MYLQDILPDPPARTTKRAPLQVLLRYVVTTWAEDIQEAHRLLGVLVFAALDKAEYTVELVPQTAAVWSSFGVPPQPAFLLLVPARFPRSEPDVPMVAQPLVIHSGLMVSLYGKLVGPGDKPIKGARIELPALQMGHYTDTQGCFHFASVPDMPTATLLSVKTRGREFEVKVKPGPSSLDEPLLIHVDLLDQ
ncbi:hypothetical protein EYB53_011325 [Candidatus Chloroploca sp. M-50]|uniref:Carboxypeptidase regulatory-like domain-containing protein n=1 Tax=Candidatus Chloroploca mongolica TaxID=2528176 RepID=A0ABS4DA44_9CHLR|nr:carboxypeptidase regulatory-like domain-containing protein [Candidatus Chloroploca mongolica]MBP1466297.1 hypothetical protein [Candidatus Chloroploca mongolica]